MPELPEVETVCRGLAKPFTGQVIASAQVRRPDLRRPFPRGLVKKITGRKIASVTRRAKYALLHMDDGSILVLHLGMSGRVKILPPAQARDYKPETHDHFLFTSVRGHMMVLNDARRFGQVMWFKSDDAMMQDASFATLGPEPLSNAFSGPTLLAALAGKKTAIKVALLDQRVVAGIGNIYASEALYIAGIKPTRAAGTIRGDEAEALVAAIRQILTKAIESGGSSLRDHRQTNGEMGYFQFEFAVYDREGDACARCGKPIQRLVQGGRSTFYCPGCQK
ncbi:bifunctional DNA-formamidopyrimidine glycosylase/DNA-(apurinic or apyrimidinic site) lyase [Micavibrio aeruginosavorus]|uniref:Formamidopyrimidine-DNA glycosylase n=1 Tax=Micavibrio aeruginosavorus EPB TaxID=349215 RepID=M4VCS2_9BACT|nr:bifunctional DNA-formamidopyrimidine glycosylase/DNA-(apurinic or apyrimidinic site) lyase [Micavibrio aeruginosavorus]AGH97192.1 Formamidopyrimidine-DNA glycosylase [Micavibrio aeruginosavorus EPB]